jgi:hypothetical protein
MANPVYEGKATVMLVCGDDEAAKKTVLQLVSDIGFEAIQRTRRKELIMHGRSWGFPRRASLRSSSSTISEGVSVIDWRAIRPRSDCIKKRSMRENWKLLD